MLFLSGLTKVETELEEQSLAEDLKVENNILAEE
jgi:hypothetical protein